MNNIDLLVDNYTIDELIELFDLNDNFTIDDINNTTTYFLKLYNKNKSKKHANFILQARNLLIDFLEKQKFINSNNTTDIDTDSDTDTDTDTYTDIIDNINIDPDDIIQRNNLGLTKSQLIKKQNNNNFKNQNILDSINNNNDFIVKEQSINVKETHNLNITRGNLNPNLKNTSSVILNIDSQFRPDLFVSSSNFSFDLSEPLYKVVNYSLINFEIQHSWYIIDDAYGTNKFFLDISGSNDNTIIIPNGNFTIEELLININNQINSIYSSNIIDFSYNHNTNKTIINNNTGNPIDIIFYDSLKVYNNYNTNAKTNYNLGWILGFRNTNYTINSLSSITSEGLIDLYGPKYLILCIDDFNHNYISKGMITMGENITKLNYPDYFTPDLSLNDPNFKFDFNTNTWIPSNLTIAQAYTIQEIAAARTTNSVNRFYGTKSSNVFGRIFLERKNGNNFGIIFNASSHLKQLNRTFFGPVDIQRMNISLYNDKGQLMNLNNQDFSFALSIEQLYQY
jgi:hypothetical protein